MLKPFQKLWPKTTAASNSIARCQGWRAAFSPQRWTGMRVDLDKQLKFPDHVTSTSLRPDIVLSSVSSRQVLLIELTVPWEDRIEEANERKRSKYQELVEQCQRGGWKARCEPIEVGCRGFAGRSLCKVYTLLGITGVEKRKAIKSTMEAAERASRWLWIRRSDLWANATGIQARV